MTAVTWHRCSGSPADWPMRGVRLPTVKERWYDYNRRLSWQPNLHRPHIALTRTPQTTTTAELLAVGSGYRWAILYTRKVLGGIECTRCGLLRSMFPATVSLSVWQSVCLSRGFAVQNQLDRSRSRSPTARGGKFDAAFTLWIKPSQSSYIKTHNVITDNYKKIRRKCQLFDSTSERRLQRLQLLQKHNVRIKSSARNDHCPLWHKLKDGDANDAAAAMMTWRS